MELKVNDYQLPATITFNYEELKQEITEKVSMYETLIYTDEQIKDAKTDKANLNKLKKALNDERIRLEKEYMQPFNTTKAQFNEIIALIDKPVSAIDSQVKAYEEKEKADKLESIKTLFNEMGFQPFVTLEMIMDDKWLNKSESMKKIEEQLQSEMYRIGNDITTLSNLPEFGFEATEVYKTTLDINKAINEAKRMSEVAKARAEHEAKIKAQEEERKKTEVMNPPVEEVAVSKMENEEPVKQWMSFSAYLSVEDAKALKQFFNDRNIEFKAI